MLTSYRWYALVGVASGLIASASMAIAEAGNEAVWPFFVNSAIMCPLCTASAVAFRFGWGSEP